MVLVVRPTRLDELTARFNTHAQARFYVEHLGADFREYEDEHAVYQEAVATASAAIRRIARLQVLKRAFLPNFLFAPDDLVVALGQDGVVANTLKYLKGQPLVGINPDPKRNEGVLLPFAVADLPKVLPEALAGQRPTRSVSMAKAQLNDGQALYAVNDFFIGASSHTSARYVITQSGRQERQSSSGVIVSTGLGSSGWLRGVLAGAAGIMTGVCGHGAQAPDLSRPTPWDADHLFFSVREPWPSKTSGATVVFGKVTREAPLKLRSLMPERGVIFSDGIEADFLAFNSGTEAVITLAERTGTLIF